MSSSIIPYVQALKWPFVALLCFTVIIFLFKQQLSEFLGRVNSVGKDGLKAIPFSQPQEQQKHDVERENSQSIQELFQTLRPLPVREREQFIKADLEQRKLASSSDTVNFLIAALADHQIALFCERTYKNICGSQIRLLRYANTNKVISAQDLKAHFDHIKKLFAPSFNNWTPDGYISYLLNSSLLTKQENAYLLTPLGVEFLSYLAKRGYSDDQPL